MKRIDLNCDMGEGMSHDAALMPLITSANIACGFHAGNGDLIRRTIDLALHYHVHIGAHPSFRDRENFGRKEMLISDEKLYAIVIEQLIKIDLVAREMGATMHHVKPHGALYNMAARDPDIAAVIVQTIKDFNEDLIVYGLSGSHLISEAKAAGLKTASEVFADRSYQDDGSLTPRNREGALITDEEKSVGQVLQMLNGTVTTISGKIIPIEAETICLHSDGVHALAFAKRIHQALQDHHLAASI
ncbi:MAG: 5-oxoprolinase subunit PxpA [Flavisolibacter sp.]